MCVCVRACVRACVSASGCAYVRVFMHLEQSLWTRFVCFINALIMIIVMVNMPQC